MDVDYIPDYISRLSNERLEQEIARIYWAGHKEYPGTQMPERGHLEWLWKEFERREMK